jgi:succinate dehydrogenase hydrophobic anchor subunit
VARLEATPGELAMRNARPAPMSAGLRITVLAVCALLWLSGALWSLLHHVFADRNEFGPLPNAWEAPLMRLHGLIAVAAVFLFGWIGASHILARWSTLANRRSGLGLLVCALVLLASGYALYYTTGAFHQAAGVLHEWLGLASLGVALAHWLGIRTPR